MSEEKQTSPAPQAESAPQEEPVSRENSHPQRRSSRSQQKRRQRSVFQYITILFAAAFVLLLFTFIMERRQNQLLQQENQEQIDNLQQSVTAVQSLDNLYKENEELRDQVASLEQQLQTAAQDLQSEKTTLLQKVEGQEKSLQAMDWFWQIDEAYAKGRYSLCRSLIQNLQSAGLVEYLPKESTTENDRFSPYDRYQEIYENLY
ncbi:hypothetical protein [Pseudoflavonifractor phocaeensis]|uniref:hypothetical protein n=1 Tax=Pseudoflavonifractor phocaeensis TaxID=1870988 RepID=UPI001F33855A|nr:hypothetical protein [Pseudoflavonifractor phocaeensis]MCF2662508.1 hypothetical protein [Pseudoflavonifractor phocaeensis]